MRFVVELTDGVTTQLGMTGTQAAATSFPQPLTQVKDILQANGIDVGVHVYSVTLANNTGGVTAKLYLETSMQNEDATDALWVRIGDASGIDFASALSSGKPKQFVFSITEDIGRYLRWRIALDASGAGSALNLSTIFKITVLGHS
jgi:hypothetical protein